MAKSKCVNCGEAMQPYYARDGSTIFICDNVRLTIKKDGMVPYGFMFCKIDVADQIQPLIDMTPKLNNKDVDQLSPLLVDSKEAIDIYAKLQSLKASFQRLAKKLTIEELREATENTISDVKLLESANLAIMLGLKEQQLPQLFNGAVKLGYALGITSEKAIESLSKGLARRSRLILDNIGITFKAEQAYNWFKVEYNVDKLSETDKTLAWQQYAIKLITEKAEKLEINEKQAKRDQLRARIENMKAEYGKDLV